MKKLCLIVGVSLTLSKSHGQPEITAANLTGNFTATLYTNSADAFDPGPAGPSQVWDYSGRQISGQCSLIFVPAAGTPYAGAFPQAALTHHYIGCFDDLWQYYKPSENKLELYGEIFPGRLMLGYMDPKTVVEFPYTFNHQFTDTYRIFGQGPEITFTAEYDAYGTLILPFGTYTDVVRQKTITDGMADYTWYNVQPFYPIMQTIMADDMIFMIENTTLGTPANRPQMEITAYPNPAHDVLHLKIDGGNSRKLTFSIYDCSGKNILQKTETIDNEVKFPVAGLSAGLYLLIAVDENGKIYSEKFSKI